MNKRVVITGVGVVSPIGLDKETFLASILSGKHGFGRVSSFDPAAYPCHIAAEVKDFVPDAYMDKKKTKRVCRFAQFAVAGAKMALQDAEIDPSKLEPDRVGVIVGSGIGGLHTVEAEHKVLLARGPRRVTPFLIPMLLTNIAPGEIAIEFGFEGINYSVSSACATSNHALGEALCHLRMGDADVIIAGGTEAAITPLAFAGFCQAKALTCGFNDDPARSSRPFDRKRSGFVMGEGAGILVLETEEHALKRKAKIYAELAGYGATDDAYHETAPKPDAKAAIRAMKLALANAGLVPDDIGYINAHGTSTELNDKIETLAIKTVFGERAYKIPVSSTKSMTGHLLGAAGAVELIATLLCQQKGYVHPTINYEEKDPECDLDYVPNVARQLTFRNAVSNSLGFGGHNAVIVIKAYNHLNA